MPKQGSEPMALTALKVKNAKPGRHVELVHLVLGSLHIY